MTPTQQFRRPFLTALVFLLALGTFLLAHRAKSSQYVSTTSTGYLAKAVKMSGDRCQTAAVAERPTTEFTYLDLHVVLLPHVPDSTQLPPAVSLDAFHYRPPPSLA